jgi:spore coat polysaccharide biosynthesis protein SpsF (cytidylyltransferase family)
MPLGRATVLDHVVERAKQFSSQVVVCTSIGDDDDPIEEHCKSLGIVCIRGSLDDVFSRFRGALMDDRVQTSEFFARITADSPLLSVELAESMVSALSSSVDYVRADYSAIPVGTGVEFVRTKAFLSLDPDALDAPEREHVTLALYEKPGRFRVVEVKAPEPLARPEYRLTLDYAEDYELMKRIFDANNTPTTRDVIALLDDQPDWADLNAHCGQRLARTEE